MSGKSISQRDYMRELLVQFGSDRDKVCATYAQAERDGVVSRKKNTTGTSPEGYAIALWKDGARRGWLKVK